MLKEDGSTLESGKSKSHVDLVVPPHGHFYRDHLKRCKHCKEFPDSLCAIGSTLLTIAKRGSY